MNSDREINSRKESILRKWGLESIVRQFIRSIGTTLTQVLREAFKNLLSKK